MVQNHNEEFHPVWYTLPELAGIVPQCPYYLDEGKSKQELTGNGYQNLHVLTRAAYYVESAAGSDVSGKYILRVSADDYYKLYVNGVFVGQGPAPAYPEKYYYNEIDITPYLQEGDNTIALHAYYQGLRNRVWNSAEGRFAVMGQVNGQELLWKYQISEAYKGERKIGYDT